MRKRLIVVAVVILSFAIQARAELRADFDCNGKADTAVSSRVGDDLLWTIYLDSGEMINGLALGQAGSEAFAYDLDGDACVELNAITKQGLNSVSLAASATPKMVGGFLCDKQIRIRDGSGGFVNNPRNSKGKVKLVAPSTYTRKLRAVRLGKNGEILETAPFVRGNEWGNRRRFYSKNSPRSYGRNIVWILDLKSGERHCALVPEPWKRYD